MPALARSTSPGSTRSGNTLVNQPTVRDRSRSSSSCSRPWPSTSTSTPEPVPPRRLRRHSATASARPASSTSLISPWNAVGTVVSSAEVVSGGSTTRSDLAVP